MTFQIRSRGGIHPHLPIPLIDGQHSSTDIEMVMEPSESLRSRYAHMWDPGQKELGGYFLPPFQRPPRWSREQQARFVESALLGAGLGDIVVVDAANEPMQSKERYAATDRWLLDGQQRITALLAYRNDEVVALEGTECEHRWSDLTISEKRRVGRLQLGIYRVRTSSIEYAKEIYRRMNFGGTPHTEEDRPK